ncbi:MAG TPA: nitroreductase family deazaflavin-dependent oxidoreductase [Anaerolineales bacterium]|nr:nitroreductase family deazaflavin-dependent oxidoreductase [Anaerolineales bacterium]HNN14019.1 nitroreductase family deazaflavin-dependent oxidoreductase [Anaerolineales bacterium]HNO31577.1 nitroreductase family deazaflavin-dependent oxidoreductase [Anaerolineales bacterium]
MTDLSQWAKEEYCYLTTRGRVTGRPHQIEIWFVVHAGALYLMSGGMDKSDWVKNLLKEPQVTLRIAGQTFPALARVQPDMDDAIIRTLMADKYRERESDGSLSEWAQTALVVQFTPAL